jgi:hypothetical protein
MEGVMELSGRLKKPVVVDPAVEHIDFYRGGQVNLSIDKLNIHGTAKAAWTMKLKNSRSTTGPKFINA